MIARLKGKIISKSPDFIIMDVNGVGYQVFIPLSTFYELSDPEETVALHTHTHVREDALQLYGFFTLEEKTMFLCLTGVSGIGPKLAINILSGIGVLDLEKAIVSGDVRRIVSIPGVGKKTAERIVLELRDKVAKKANETIESVPAVNLRDQLYSDAVSALTNLGYKRAEAENVLDMIRKGSEESISLEELLKRGLRVMVQK